MSNTLKRDKIQYTGQVDKTIKLKKTNKQTKQNKTKDLKTV